MNVFSRSIALVVLVTFVTASVIAVPAAATTGSTAVATERKPRPRDRPDSGKDGKGDDRRKPPPRDDGDGTRPPRGKGDPPDNRRPETPDPPPPEPPGWVEIYGVHEHYYYYDDYYPDRPLPPQSESAELVGLYGLAAATVMVLNLMYASDDHNNHDALGITGIALGATGVIWSLNADQPWERRTLLVAGLFSVGFALLAWSSDEPDEPTVTFDPDPQATAGISFSF